MFGSTVEMKRSSTIFHEMTACYQKYMFDNMHVGISFWEMKCIIKNYTSIWVSFYFNWSSLKYFNIFCIMFSTSVHIQECKEPVELRLSQQTEIRAVLLRRLSGAWSPSSDVPQGHTHYMLNINSSYMSTWVKTLLFGWFCCHYAINSRTTAESSGWGINLCSD